MVEKGVFFFFFFFSFPGPSLVPPGERSGGAMAALPVSVGRADVVVEVGLEQPLIKEK